ncbi:MAG: WD40/YVTN/BNR-like repeat-containing protein, partial [Dehalococcoidales bacterium]
MKASKKIRIKNYLIQRAGKGAGRAAAFTVLLFLAVAVPSNILNGSNAEVATTGGQFSSLIQSNAEQTSSYVWKKLGGPHGGIGYDIRMRPDNPDIMYVTDAWAGLHKSEDGGQTWFPANTGIDARTGPSGDAIPVFSVTVDPHNPDVLWSGLTGQRGVYKSTDGGETWSLKVNGIREQGITFRGFTVDPHDPDIVYAAGEISSGEWAGREQMGVMFDRTKGKVYRTTNGGDSWTAIWSGDNLARYVWIDPRDSDVIYVSTG